MSDIKRIVVTGMGWVTPLGHDLDTVWGRMVRAESGVAKNDRFQADTFPTNFAAQVRDYDFRQYVNDADVHATAGAHTQYALGAARQAWTQSCLGDYVERNPKRIGIYLGAGEGVLDIHTHAKSHIAAWDEASDRIDAKKWVDAAKQYIDPWSEIEQEPNMPAAHIAREYGLRGPVYNCLTACAASTQAVGEATSMLKRGDADVMITGGTHTMLHVLGMTGFNRLTALSTRNDEFDSAARPFDRTRDGFVMGEGSGIVVLETLEHATKRGATPLAEIIGFGSSADAYRITDMHPEGEGPGAAISQALDEAGLDPHATDDEGRPPIHYISAHGTGTKENDSIETKAIKRVFGANAPKIPVSSIKSMMGHLICAAGAVELITCILAIQNQTLPPTRNLHHPDPDLDLDYVPNEARPARIDTCLSNSFGFGGQNDTVIVRRFRGE